MTRYPSPEALDKNRFGKARVIRSEAEALAAADDVASFWRKGSARRDQVQTLPWEELEYLSHSGLNAIRLPLELGGAGIATPVYLDVVRKLAMADSSLAQLYFVDSLKGYHIDQLAKPQAKFLAEQVLQGARFGNATAERVREDGADYGATFSRDGDHYLLSGEKYFCTGSVTSHWITVPGKFADGSQAVAIVPNGAAGLELGEDWDVVGQRTTFSVSASFRKVRIPADRLIFRDDEQPLAGAVRFAQTQLVHAALQVGMGDGALQTAHRLFRQRFVAGKTRDRLAELLLQWEADSAAAWAVVQYAARKSDKALSDRLVGTHRASLAAVATDEAKSLAYVYGPQWTQRLIDFLDQGDVAEALGFDRHWRDARTHSLHDPARWRQSFVGNYWLNGRAPPDLARRLVEEQQWNGLQALAV